MAAEIVTSPQRMQQRFLELRAELLHIDSGDFRALLVADKPTIEDMQMIFEKSIGALCQECRKSNPLAHRIDISCSAIKEGREVIRGAWTVIFEDENLLSDPNINRDK